MLLVTKKRVRDRTTGNRSSIRLYDVSPLYQLRPRRATYVFLSHKETQTISALVAAAILLAKMVFVCVTYQRGAASQIQFLAQAADVHFGGSFGDVQHFGDFTV